MFDIVAAKLFTRYIVGKDLSLKLTKDSGHTPISFYRLITRTIEDNLLKCLK